MRIRRALLAWLPMLLVLSCAAPSELARRSELSLSQGDAAKAFDWARRALDKQPSNPQARVAMTNAARVLMDEAKVRIMNLAEVDTVGAARQSLDLDGFRAQLVRYRIVLPHDGAFEANEARIRSGAAGIFYNEANHSLAAHRPRDAYRGFAEAQRYVPRYRDCAERMDRAYALALTRVAILPFNNEVAVSALSQQLMEQTYGQVVRQMSARPFAFTEMIGSDQIYEKLTISQMIHMTRAQAVRLGRSIGAQRIVIGRYYGLRSNTSNDAYRTTVYRRVSEKDADGTSHDRWVEQRMEVITRERRVAVNFEFEVIDTDDETSLARKGDERSVLARTAFTSFDPVGKCDDYSLVTPDRRSADPEQAKRIEGEWSGKFGAMALPRFLEQTARRSERTHYEPRFRGEFAGSNATVFLDDLPPNGDLAYIALSDLWQPLMVTLRDLDGRDTPDLRGVAADE